MLNGFIVKTLIDSFDSFRHWSHYSFRDSASASVNSVFLYSFLLTWYPAINWRVKEQIHECLSVSSGMCLSLPQHRTHWIDSRQFTQVTYKLSFVVVVVYFFLCSHVRLLSTYMYFRIYCTKNSLTHSDNFCRLISFRSCTLIRCSGPFFFSMWESERFAKFSLNLFESFKFLIFH